MGELQRKTRALQKLLVWVTGLCILYLLMESHRAVRANVVPEKKTIEMDILVSGLVVMTTIHLDDMVPIPVTIPRWED